MKKQNMEANILDEGLKEKRIELEVELKNTKLLQNISTELIVENNIQILFEKIIDGAMQIMHSEYASIQMLHTAHDNTRKLQLLAFRGFNEKAAKFWKWVPVDEAGSTCGEALRKGYRIIVSDVKECDFMQETQDLCIYLQTGIHAVQSTPLYSRNGRMLGMISTHWSQPHQPLEGDLRLLDVLARQAADLIEQKQSEDRIKWDKEKAEILYEITEKLLASTHPQEIVEELCVQVMKFLKCDVFFNYLIDEERMKLHLNSYAGIQEELIDKIEWLDYGVAICGCVARDGKRIVAERVQETPDQRTNLIKSLGIKAYVCHPLMGKNTVIGTLSFGTKSKDAFNEDEIALMKATSTQVSIAMNRIKTEEVLRRQQQLMIQAESEKREALEKAINMKDEFLSLISHELRTPINVINTAVQALNHMYSEEMSDKVKKYIRTIRQNTFRQLRLVNNLLDITRANSGHMKINKKNIDIVFLTKIITESIYQYASLKGVEVTFISSLEKKIIGIDDEKYERIILNLLSNAIKFTPKDKSIKVSLSSIKDNIRIDIEDNGIGIPRDKIDVIFERFGQVDSSLSRQAEGTGIGLSLVKNFIEALDGSISVESEVGRGSTFTLQLPSKEVAEEQDEKQMIDLLNNRLVHITNVEFSDIYL
ncbi:multi-sensor hybrid histidine kinase [Clostridium aceticum]|uniref:histidine kinase n=2 Tax=Clostridium aceticum TaxID=84022 RepID=A0A0G3WHR4_9CLOT|nr:multi-sensor hybrid histidine kinase [Clostridium aceticum]